MTNKQLADLQKKKIKDQNVDVEEIIGHTKKGHQQAAVIKDELHKQNHLLDDVEKDVFVIINIRSIKLRVI
jgi:hypothetical protein